MPKRKLTLALVLAGAFAIPAAGLHAAAGDEKLQKAIAEEEKQKAAEAAAADARKKEEEAVRAKERAEEQKRAKAKREAIERQCQFKPVMSDDDIAKCRAAYPSR
jgi:hypothetical protein